MSFCPVRRPLTRWQKIKFWWSWVRVKHISPTFTFLLIKGHFLILNTKDISDVQPMKEHK